MNNQKPILEKTRKIGHVIYSRSVIVLLALAINFILLFGLLLGIADSYPYLFGGTVLSTTIILIAILNTREDPTIKLTWAIIIAVLPVFGTLLYLFIRCDLGHRMEKRAMQQSIEMSNPYVPDNTQIMEQVRQTDKNLYNLAFYLKNTYSGHLYGNTDVTYFPLGEKKFEAMLEQIEKAEKFIFLEYFSIAPSYMWNTIEELLIQKASSGVEVRVMYDGGSSINYLPPNYPKKLAKYGIQCKVFSPFRPLISTHYNNRDHRKILIIDGKVGFTGGVNLLDRYINKREVFGHWKDTAVMLQGDGVRGLTFMFLQMWNANEKNPVYTPYLTEVTAIDISKGVVIPYADSPLDHELVGESVYLNILNQAQDYVYIMTPYLIMDNQLTGAMCFAAKRGVKVKLILPHIPDKKYAFVLAKTHYKELAEAGVEIYEYTPGFVHAKVFLADDKEAVVGTINLDYRSLYLHFECAAYMYKVSALKDIKADFDDTLAKCELITMESIQNHGLLTRISGIILKVFAPLM